MRSFFFSFLYLFGRQLISWLFSAAVWFCYYSVFVLAFICGLRAISDFYKTHAKPIAWPDKVVLMYEAGMPNLFYRAAVKGNSVYLRFKFSLTTSSNNIIELVESPSWKGCKSSWLKQYKLVESLKIGLFPYWIGTLIYIFFSFFGKGESASSIAHQDVVYHESEETEINLKQKKKKCERKIN